MKNAFKKGFLTLAITLTITACSSSQKAAEGSDTPAKVDTMAMSDTTKADTVATDTTQI